MKTEYCGKLYIKMFLPHYQRSLLAQVHFGILPLRIETGRILTKLENLRLMKGFAMQMK